MDEWMNVNAWINKSFWIIWVDFDCRYYFNIINKLANIIKAFFFSSYLNANFHKNKLKMIKGIRIFFKDFYPPIRI